MNALFLTQVNFPEFCGSPFSEIRLDEKSPPTVRCQCGVSRLWDAPGAPLGATLPAGADPEQIISVRIQVENQELRFPTDVGVLILAPPAAGPPVLQPVICSCEVLIHLKQMRSSFI